MGHSKNLEAMERYIDQKKLPLSLSGCSYRGIGVSDVVHDAKQQAQNIVEKLRKTDKNYMDLNFMV